MKQILAAILIVVTIVTLIVIAFTVNQVAREEERLKLDLQHRSTILAESLVETVEPNFPEKSPEYFQQIVKKSSDEERFAAISIYDNKGTPIAASEIASGSAEIQKIASDAMDADKASGSFTELGGKKIYALAIPLHADKSVVGALTVMQNAGYIDDRLFEVWQNNLIRLLIQASLISLAVLLILRWIIYEPVKGLVESLKSIRSGATTSYSNLPSSFIFKPLVKEIVSIRQSLFEARTAASEEARLRLEKIDSPWTEERLKEFVKETLKDRPIFLISNREPYIHTKHGREIRYYVPASGMVTALEPIMQATGGTWIASADGDADKLVVDRNNKVKVPPDEPKYTLKRIWLTEEEKQGFYNGFSNEGLWPLCHISHTRPIFRKEDWEQYKIVNGKFAQTIIAEIKKYENPIILIQDFHLSILARMIKNSKPDAIIGLFWHIPWPNPESFSICPWKKEILDGMLGADILGFHTQLHCNNFIETAGRELESLIDYEQFTITKSNHTSYIKPFPISIAFPDPSSTTNDEDFNKEKFLKELGIKTQYIGLGVDRLDYTKGILERLKAIEIFLINNPTYVRNFTFVQIAAPSRSKIKKYQEFAQDVRDEVERINKTFRKNGWKPVILLEKHHNKEEVYNFYKIANVCLVTSLHDGMNLVAKEYISSRSDERGVLILSQYTGASRELKDALIINPYNGEQTAEAIREALEMRIVEQTRRMRKMRQTIQNYNVYRWSAEFLKSLINLG